MDEQAQRNRQAYAAAVLEKGPRICAYPGCDVEIAVNDLMLNPKKLVCDAHHMAWRKLRSEQRKLLKRAVAA